MDSIASLTEMAKHQGQIAKLLRLLAEAGLTKEALDVPIADPEMRKRLVRFWLAGGFEPSTSQERAREIMGENFFGIQEAVKYLKVNPTNSQLASLKEIPFSEEVLRSCADTHVLVAVFPLSILDIRDKVQGKGLFRGQDRFNRARYTKEKGETSWHMVHITSVLNSEEKSWDEQQALLDKNEETPTSQVLVYAVTIYYLATGEQLFAGEAVRCSDVVSRGVHACLSLDDSTGLLGSYSDGGRDFDLRIASERKSG